MIIVITPPEFIPHEESIINRLFENGLHLLHLRKPGGSRKDYENFIQKIIPAFRNRIVIHDHFGLVKTYEMCIRDSVTIALQIRTGNIQRNIRRIDYPV